MSVFGVYNDYCRKTRTGNPPRGWRAEMTNLLFVEKPKGTDGLNFSTQENNAAQRAILNLFQKWDLTTNEQSILLGGLSTRTLQRWRNGEYGKIDIDLSTRLSILLGIHKSLRILFDDLSRVYEWVKKPNNAFEGKSALDVMLMGRIIDLYSVRNYLDAARGAW